MLIPAGDARVRAKGRALMERRHRRGGGINEDGGTTEELTLVPRASTRGESEVRMRSRGAWMIMSGAGAVAMTILVAAVWHAGFKSEMPLVFAIPLYAVGFGAIYIGLVEYLSRSSRDNQLAALEQGRRLERGLLQLVELLPEEMQQQWFRGFGSGASEFSTGTDGVRPRGSTGDVLKMRRSRNR